MTKVTQIHLWQVISISAFCYLPRGNVSPSCHPERSPPEIPPSLCSVLLRSSTTLRFAQNDTGGRSRTRRATRSIGIYDGKNAVLARDPARLCLALLRSSTAPPRVILSEGVSPNRTAKRRRVLRDGISEGASLRMTRAGFRFAEEYVFN